MHTFAVSRFTTYADGWRGGSTTSGIRDEQRARSIYEEERDRARSAFIDSHPFIHHGEPISWGVSLWPEGAPFPLDIAGQSIISN